MKVTGVNHVQVNVTAAELPAARDFYLGFLGMTEIPRPPVFKSDGFWFRAGEREMHIGVEENVDRRATRAHVAYEVTDLPGWRRKIEAAKLPIKDQRSAQNPRLRALPLSRPLWEQHRAHTESLKPRMNADKRRYEI